MIAACWDLLGPIVSAARLGLPDPSVLDFDAFVLAGKAALRGALAQAYSLKRTLAEEAALALPLGKWLPYIYPPTAALLFGPLSTIVSSTSFLVFQGASLFLFLTGIASLGARGSRFVLVASALPIVCLNVRAGHSGLLLAGLAVVPPAMTGACAPTGL